MDDWLESALAESRRRGFLGPGDLEPHIAHAEGFLRAWESSHTEPPVRFLDLGSGGGLPGLVLLARWNSEGCLLDAMVKRAGFLDEVLGWSGAPHGGTVVCGRAEEVARRTGFDGEFDLVTVRSFGPPAVVAECATRFLKTGGLLVVSEPPDVESQRRWPQQEASRLGLGVRQFVRYGSGYQILEKAGPTPKKYPRENGIPKKFPLF